MQIILATYDESDPEHEKLDAGLYDLSGSYTNTKLAVVSGSDFREVGEEGQFHCLHCL